MTIHENTGDHCRALATVLNHDCLCTTLSPESIVRVLHHDDEIQQNFSRALSTTQTHLFANTPYFASCRQVERMAELIHAIESVVALPAYQQRVLAWAPEIAQSNPGPLGVFFGYDFHLQDTNPQLIEINTNAGGALINLALAKAQRAYCQDIDEPTPHQNTIAKIEQELVDMFRSEWRLQTGNMELKSIAIVDAAPETQHLNQEFHLFEKLFLKHGINAIVADPKDLKLKGDGLWYDNLKIDLVYNRLTDFSLCEKSNIALREAYLSKKVVLTPHPHAHALYADKRNLTLLTNDDLLSSWGVKASTRAVLRSGIPNTVLVDEENCDNLWRDRRRLFFKPAAGYGGKATYRGDKLTRRVWREILAGDYIAQEIVAPSRRRLQTRDTAVALKVDVRNYAYSGQVQLLAARMYQGQTTNFRTDGGGFAAVFVIDDARSCALSHAATGTRLSTLVNPFHLFSHGQPFIPT